MDRIYRLSKHPPSVIAIFSDHQTSFSRASVTIQQLLVFSCVHKDHRHLKRHHSEQFGGVYEYDFSKALRRALRHTDLCGHAAKAPNIYVKVRGSDKDTVVVHQLADSSPLLEG